MFIDLLVIHNQFHLMKTKQYLKKQVIPAARLETCLFKGSKFPFITEYFKAPKKPIFPISKWMSARLCWLQYQISFNFEVILAQKWCNRRETFYLERTFHLSVISSHLPKITMMIWSSQFPCQLLLVLITLLHLHDQSQQIPHCRTENLLTWKTKFEWEKKPTNLAVDRTIMYWMSNKWHWYD